MEDTSYLIEEEAANILGVSPDTLRGWRSRGVPLPFYRIGPKLVRYRRSDLDAFILAGRSTAGEE